MAYEEKQIPHHIMLEGRASLTVSGVEEVESFDENTIVMVTVKGTWWCGGGPAHRKAQPGRGRPEGGGDGGLPDLRGRGTGEGRLPGPAAALRWRSPSRGRPPP